ncbi:MAG: nucleotidyltransferase domain-containing protein, partial [Dehalococcoidia bacterium]
MTADRTGGHSIESLLRALGEWGEAHLDVVAIGLVGSHARGSARPDSDVDLIV